MFGSSLDDPVMKMYEAQAIVVEKDQEIERMRQEIERLRLGNSNKNQQKLAQNVTTGQQESAIAKNKQIKRLAVKLNAKQLKEQGKLRNQQNLMGHAQKATQSENIIEKQTGVQQNTSVLILGGNENLNTIYLLDSKAPSWNKLSITLPMRMSVFGAAVLNEEIYIFGGHVTDYQQDCYKLKDDGSWIQLASMNQKRAFISSSSLVYKGDIWVIGGYSGDSREYLKSVEMYDISQDKWTYMPEMNDARCNAATAVFKDRIFVTGGENEKFLKSVEMFDSKLQKWILFCDLPFGISGHTMLISNSTLSIFGGLSGSGKLNNVWEMDIEDPEKKWTQKQSFNHPRDSFGIGKLSNGLIVFGDGGKNGETSEIFDGNEWIDGPKLPQNLSQFAYTSIPRSLEESFLKKFL